MQLESLPSSIEIFTEELPKSIPKNSFYAPLIKLFNGNNKNKKE